MTAALLQLEGLMRALVITRTMCCAAGDRSCLPLFQGSESWRSQEKPVSALEATQQKRRNLTVGQS